MDLETACRTQVVRDNMKNAKDKWLPSMINGFKRLSVSRSTTVSAKGLQKLESTPAGEGKLAGCVGASVGDAVGAGVLTVQCRSDTCDGG